MDRLHALAALVQFCEPVGVGAAKSWAAIADPGSASSVASAAASDSPRLRLARRT
jgi:hypothetical protein